MRLKMLVIVLLHFPHAKKCLQLVWSMAGALIWCLIPHLKTTKKLKTKSLKKYK